jgi:uncharacterized protein (DUF1800 family)
MGIPKSILLFCATLAYATTGPVTVTVSPATVSVRAGATKQFSVYVANSTTQAVTWTASRGTISSTGKFTAPATVPSPNTATVTATTPDGKTGTATITLLNPQPTISGVSPSSVTSKLPFTFVVIGTGYLPSSKATLAGAAIACTVDSATQLTCRGTTTAAAGSAPLVISNPDPGAISSSPRSITVLPPVAVSVSPDPVSLRVGTTKQFSASVQNTTNHAVTWTASAGTISATGLYTAPATLPSPNTVRVTATASVNGASDFATVTLLNPDVNVTHLSTTQVNTNLAFTLVITGTGFIPASKVTLGGTPVTCTVNSATQITCQGKRTDPAGTVLALLVSNPDPGADSSSPRNVTVVAPIKVTLSPDKVNVRLGDTKQFSAYTQNAVDHSVTFTVAGGTASNPVNGTVTAAGLYTPPASLPANNVVMLTVTSVMDPTATDNSTITLLNPLPVITTLAPASLSPGAATITITGTGFAPNAVVLVGNAVWQNVSVTPTKIVAKGAAVAVAGGIETVKVSNPDPGAAISNVATLPVAVANPVMSYAAAVRFLEQATFGPSPDDVAHLQQVGINAWLAEQKAAAISPYDDPPSETTGLTATQGRFFYNATNGRDQLRQRVAFALGQIFVISGVKVPKAVAHVPWLRMLSARAFGNYLDLMRDVTLSPAMGKYLDMVNNDKPNPAKGIAANENYARELMQLFTIGTVMLNPDGSAKPGPVLTYDQAAIQNLGRAFTGWTYPPVPGVATSGHNPEHYFGPMVAVESLHDTGAKTLLGGVQIPAGQTALQDVNSALNNIFNHANVGPFVALRLIQHLVTSNPSGAYVQRVAAVFDNNGAGVRGDLWAVTSAILRDSEARAGDASPSGTGHLREPVLYMTQFLRALDSEAAASDTPLASRGDDMGQRLFFSPSVFNYYSPFYRTANGALAGPEFQILSPVTAISRPNFIYSALANQLGSNMRVDLTRFIDLASDPAKLVDAVSTALMRGQMPPEIRSAILTAIGATTDARTRARNALYLAATSPQYQVER